ncbi:hypothetical protein MNBD_ALPHA12-480 [hydrothermal vent metagenome]|uniref:Uncharacterized protein n=1 Tax=hydrothermal vent metagenome TaxID=652676 RepID=A0A3B0USE6_9ZZZZ
MSALKPMAIVRNTGIIALAAVLLGGCSYDYLQHSERVAYSAGNAVRANLEGQVINPSGGYMYDVSGLGKNGYVTDPGTVDPGAVDPGAVAP